MNVGHLVSSYLHVTENWIHAQMTSNAALEPFVLNRGDRINAELFPVRGQRHLSDLTAAACRREADAWEREGRSRVFFNAFRRYRGDLLHAHFGTEGVLGVPLAAALGVPLVTSFYGYDATVLPRNPAWTRALRRLFEVGTLFLAEGPALADTLVSLGCPSSRIRLAPLPVRIPAQPARPDTRKPPLLLVGGRLVEKKGVDTSLRVLARLAELTTRPFRAMVVGDGPERSRLVRLHRRLRLGDLVTFVGAVPPDEFARLLGAATAVLQMSRMARNGDAEGGAPVVLSQALAFGVPVVSTRHCDIPWIVDHERTGFIVESGDVESAAIHLARLIEDPSLCRALARAGREAARRRLSPGVCGRSLERDYADAMALGPVPRPARDERLHPDLLADIVLNFRLRAGDVDGLARLRARTRLGRDLRCRAHRAIGEVYEQRGDDARAACAFQRSRRLTPNDPYAALQEARAWLRSSTPRRAIAPLATFVSTHADRSYALTIAMAELDAHRDGPALARLLIVRAGTPAERLGFELQLVDREVGVDAAVTSRRRLRQALARFQRTRGAANGASESAQTEAALVTAYVFALRLEDRASASALKWLRDPGRVRQPVLRYRMASELASQGGSSTDWARRAFQHLGRSRGLPPDARAGAWFHLAEIGHRTGMIREARRALDRCLAIVPAHDAAIHLRETLRNRPQERR